MTIDAKYPSPSFYFGIAMINDLLTLKDKCDKFLKEIDISLEYLNLNHFGLIHSNYPEYTGLCFDDFYRKRISLEDCVHKNMMHLYTDILDGQKCEFAANRDYEICPYYDDIETMKAAYKDFVNFIRHEE